jgi:hypothetical protein
VRASHSDPAAHQTLHPARAIERNVKPGIITRDVQIEMFFLVDISHQNKHVFFLRKSRASVRDGSGALRALHLYLYVCNELLVPKPDTSRAR